MKRKILKDFVLTEISGVDRPAQPTARMSIMKRDFSLDEADKQLVEKIEKSGYSFSGYMKAEEFNEESWRLTDALVSSMRDAVLSGDESMMRQNIEEYLMAVKAVSSSDVASIGKALEKAINDKDPVTSGTEKDKMAELDDLNKQVSDLTNKLKESDLIAKMCDDEKMHMAKMGDKDKAAFMAMSAEDRKKKMATNKRDDEVIEVAGQTIAKSVVGAEMFAVMKFQQVQLKANEEAIAKAQLDAEMATLRKRADDDFAHVPGTTDERAALLKAAKAMPEAVQKTLEQVMTSYEKTIAKAFETQGHSHADSPISKSANEQVETLAKAYKEKNGGTIEAARAAVMTDELYNQIMGEAH
jgi:hypothetical protein